MLLTTSIFQEFWLGKSSTQMEEFWRLDSCVSFQKNLHTEALCKLFTLKGVFSFIQKSEVKFTLTQPGTRKGQWPSRNFHKQSFPPRRPLRKKKKEPCCGLPPLEGLTWIIHRNGLSTALHPFSDFQAKSASQQGDLPQITLTVHFWCIRYTSLLCSPLPKLNSTL